MSAHAISLSIPTGLKHEHQTYCAECGNRPALVTSKWGFFPAVILATGIIILGAGIAGECDDDLLPNPLLQQKTWLIVSGGALTLLSIPLFMWARSANQKQLKVHTETVSKADIAHRQQLTEKPPSSPTVDDSAEIEESDLHYVELNGNPDTTQEIFSENSDEED